MANKNERLLKARAAKKDEYYTRLEDIENEMRHYKKHFKDKTIFCNCDDPFESNFFKYFVLNFNRLGLKKLIATCYAGSPIAGKQLSLFDIIGDESKRDTPYKAIVTTVYDITGDGGVDMLDIAELFKQGENTLEELHGDGDFRSSECLALMDESDIVVTNPPFSLFREYIATLISHNKKFIVVGNKNAITYAEIFPLLMKNEIWIGTRPINKDFWLYVPDDEDYEKVDDNGRKIKHIMACWFTNLDIKKRHEEMILVRRYDSEVYPKYDNYDAIEVTKISDIPFDYDGIMGVPITFMDKFNPDQFEILGITDRDNKYGLTTRIYTAKDTPQYSDLNRRAAIRLENGTLKSTYARLLIRNKHPEQPKEK